MPRKYYAKRRYNKKRTYRKAPAYKRMMGHVSTGLKYGRALAAQVYQIKQMINCEKKYFDQNVSFTPTTSGTASVQLLNGIAQGDDIINRNGRSILADNLHIRWTAKVNSSATNTIMKFVVICDKKPDSSIAATYSALYASSGLNGQIDRATEGDRFVVLRQRTVKLNAGAMPAASGDIYINLKNIHVKYDGTDATGASLEGNALYIVAVSDEATNSPTMLALSRFSYYDN